MCEEDNLLHIPFPASVQKCFFFFFVTLYSYHIIPHDYPNTLLKEGAQHSLDRTLLVGCDKLPNL